MTKEEAQGRTTALGISLHQYVFVEVAKALIHSMGPKPSDGQLDWIPTGAAILTEELLEKM